MTPFYLASGSPRRRELLTQIGVAFDLLPAAIDETPLPAEAPAAYVERLAREKAQAGHAQLRGAAGVVLGADTAVILADQILGKPRDKADALAMLAALSGKVHQVLTAVAVTDGHRCETRCVATSVHFTSISPRRAEAYWDSGEPADKAGGYAIQGLGAIFVERIEGSYSAVVGLPLLECARLLEDFAIPCWQPVQPA